MKILIIDDDERICNFLSQLARNRGFSDIDVVTSGEEALIQILRKNYDMITLDLRMPGLSGLEIIAMLRNMCSHAVIAIISGYISDDIPSDVTDCSDVIIPKPIDKETFDALLDATEQVCAAMEAIRSLGTTPEVVR